MTESLEAPPIAPADALELAPQRPARAQGLRRRAARGTIVNGTYLAGLQVLAVLKSLIVAAVLVPSAYGVWATLTILLMSLIPFKYVGISDKYVQQDEADQTLAFQRAFSADLLWSVGLLAIFAAAIPLLALLYGSSEIVLPGLVLSLILPISAFQSPIWSFYRNMSFVRQRTLEGIEPILGFVVTVALAVAGLGYWSLVVGALVGALAAAIAAVAASPYPLAFHVEKDSLRGYVRFSTPLLVGYLAVLAMSQTAVLVGQATLGLAGVGAIYLTILESQSVSRIDDMVLFTLYPAICAVRERHDLLYESFWKTNRVLLLTGVPLGAAAILFTPDLIRYGIGDKWAPATTMLQLFGVVIIMDRVAFSWNYFLKAAGHTRPLAVGALVLLAGFLAFTVPLLILDGLTGFGAGMVAAVLPFLAVRLFYMRQMFPEFKPVRDLGAALLPAAVATAVALLVQLLAPATGLAQALVELGAFVVACVAVTYVSHRRLLGELIGFFRRAPSVAAAQPT